MEFIDGYIWANVYLSNNIVKIDPSTGKVLLVIDFSHLVKLAFTKSAKTKFGELDYSECLNGIAYNHKKKLFILTGKNWPSVYIVDILKK